VVYLFHLARLQLTAQLLQRLGSCLCGHDYGYGFQLIMVLGKKDSRTNKAGVGQFLDCLVGELCKPPSVGKGAPFGWGKGAL